MKYQLLILFILNISINLSAQVVSSYEINAEFFPKDAQMYNYPVSPDAYMRAYSKIMFSEIKKDTITFYLHGELRVDSILIDHKKINYETEKKYFYYSYNLIALQVRISAIDVTTESNMFVYYSGFLNPSRARGLSDYMFINKDEGVFLRSYGYSLWFPIFLDSNEESYKCDFEKVTIKLPEGYKCIVGGEMIEEFVRDGIYTTSWRPGITDITDIQCTAQIFKVNSKDNVIVYYMSDKSNSEKILNYVIRLRNLFSENLKSVDKTAPIYIMEMPRYGDISSANVVGISGKNFSSFDNGLESKLTIAHELVHPYVDIPVSIDNPFYAFVVEGFPSFFQMYALKKMDGETYNLKEAIRRIEGSYLEKRKTGKTRRGNILPIEKAILKISFDEIGSYKDTFVLNDRVWLFFYSIWNAMGNDMFDMFLKELFILNQIDYKSFEEIILKYLPDFKVKLNTWLNTTDYPEEIRISE